MGLTIFAQRMKQARNMKGYKQNELAKAIGVTPNTISSYEKADTDGSGKKPTLENAQAIAETLEVSLDWLCGMSDNAAVSYAEFTAREYFKSLVIILSETSSTLKEVNTLALNEIAQPFVKKVTDLIHVYRDGSIPEDLFNVCIDKIIDDFSGYTTFASCIVKNSDIARIEQQLYGLLTDDYEANTGVYNIQIPSDGIEKELCLNLYITQNLRKKYTGLPFNNSEQKEIAYNGEHQTSKK